MNNEQLRIKAKELLENKTVSIVIGFEEGTAGSVRPVFITAPGDAHKLIYDERCVHNLAIYLKKKEVKRAGRVAIFASHVVMKSIVILASENQIAENDILVVGISTDGTLIDLPDFEAVAKYIKENPVEYKRDDKALLEKIDRMSPQERWDFWQNEFFKCFKCYACRGACPMCYCHRCTVDCNQPQWISVPSHNIGNLEWHLMRAMHLAGRCIECGQCGDACPVGIPVNILSLKLSEDISKNFAYKAGTILKQNYVLSTYNPNDNENFII